MEVEDLLSPGAGTPAAAAAGGMLLSDSADLPLVFADDGELQRLVAQLPVMSAAAAFDGVVDFHQQQQQQQLAGISGAAGSGDGLEVCPLWHHQQWPGLDNAAPPGAASSQQLAVQLAAAGAAAAGAGSLAPRTGMQRLHVGVSQLAGGGIRHVASQAAAQQHLHQQQLAGPGYSWGPGASQGVLASGGNSSASSRLAASVSPRPVQPLRNVAPSAGAAAQGFMALLQDEPSEGEVPAPPPPPAAAPAPPPECSFLSLLQPAVGQQQLLEPPVSINNPRLPRKRGAAAKGSSRRDGPAPRHILVAVEQAAKKIAERSGQRKPVLNLLQAAKFNAATGAAATAAPDSSSNAAAPASHEPEQQAARGSTAAAGGITSARERVQALADAVDPVCISLRSALLLEGRAAAKGGTRSDEEGNGGHRLGQWMMFPEAHSSSSGGGVVAAAAAEAAARDAALRVAEGEQQHAARVKQAISACGDDEHKAEELARQLVEHVRATRGPAAAQQQQQQPGPSAAVPAPRLLLPSQPPGAFAAEPPFVPPAAPDVAAAEHAAGAGYTAVTPCGRAAGAASGQEPQQVPAVEDSSAAPAAAAPVAEPSTGRPRRQAAKRAAPAAAASRGHPKRARKQSCKLHDMEVDGGDGAAAGSSASGGSNEQQQQEEASDGGGPALTAGSSHSAGRDGASEEEEGGAANGGLSSGAGLAGSALDKPFYYFHSTTGERTPVTARMAQQHYHLPARQAAAKLGMGGTTFKKCCGELDISWPFRQVRSMDTLIEDVQAYAAARGDVDGEAANVLAQLASYRQQLMEDTRLPIPPAIKTLRAAVHKKKHKRNKAQRSKKKPTQTQTQTQTKKGGAKTQTKKAGGKA